jgi:hypothetical protein
MIAVVHLVWGPLGPGALREFLTSYRRHQAGIEHDLVMAFNNVEAHQSPALLAELDGVEHQLLTLPDAVQDLAAYMQAARRLEHERVCFLNSYSEILADGWLAKLAEALDQPAAGIAGATGTWASVRSATLNALLLPNPYRRVLPPRSVAREELAAIELELARERAGDGDAPMPADTSARAPSARTLLGRVWATLKTLPPMPEQLLRFDGFPAEHVRTNAFMVDRRTFLGLKTGAIERKMDAYRLESGHTSFTRQLHSQGLRTLVVDRHGACYDAPQWPESNTLWQGDQEGLLVADNQTRIYANGGPDRRALLSAFAWGPHARPRVSAQAVASS